MKTKMNLRNKFAALFTCILTVMLSLCVFATPALAATTGTPGYPTTTTQKTYPTASSLDASSLSTTYVLDHYGLLNTEKRATLESQAKAISESANCGTYLLLVDRIGNLSARDYAINYYLNNKLGMGSEKSGILFLVAVDSRDYVTITYGKGITMYTDYRISQMENDIVSQLSSNYWSSASTVYYEMAEKTVNFYLETGEPWDSFNDPEDFTNTIYFKIGVGVLVGLIIALMVVKKWESEMKTARRRDEAHEYLVRGSLVLTRQSDRYITTTRSVVKVESDGPRGGSSIGSGGFGGSGGGKF